MARHSYCMPCGEKRIDVDAVVVIDGDPICAPCARTVGQPPTEFGIIYERMQQPVPEPVECRRGCGKLTHAGNCKGIGRRDLTKLPEPVPVGEGAAR